MLEKIAKWLTRKPKLVAMMAVLMLIPAAIGYISTRINYDILSYLPEDLESSHGEKLLEEPFKMAATSMLVVESMPAGYTNSLLNDINANDGVSHDPRQLPGYVLRRRRYHDDHSVQPPRRLGRDHGGHRAGPAGL